jgi:membrane-bound lytic murein transglycosylase B
VSVRALSRRALMIGAATLWNGRARAEPADAFGAFLAGLWPEAAAQGISRATFDLAFAGVTPDPRVLGAMAHAPEYGKPFGAYVESLASPSRIAIGMRKLAQWADTARAVEQKYGVPGAMLVSIWGIESSFGDSQDRWDVVRSIATLAQAKIQQPYFHDELISALKIVQSRQIPRPQLPGPVAGAWGKTQFMPSS